MRPSSLSIVKFPKSKSDIPIISEIFPDFNKVRHFLCRNLRYDDTVYRQHVCFRERVRMPEKPRDGDHSGNTDISSILSDSDFIL